jgi:cob(I)alamin adenosyltransferase
MDGQYKNQFGIAYLNRLSSLCFVLEVNEIQSGCGTNPTLAKGK